jgi:hypothetical protein
MKKIIILLALIVFIGCKSRKTIVKTEVPLEITTEVVTELKTEELIQ